MLSKEKIRPKTCQLLNTAITKNELYFNDLRSSTDGFKLDVFLHTKNRNINFTTKNSRNVFDDHFKRIELKKK